MRPLDFRDLALYLIGSTPNEAALRSAVSRLYYGLHHESCCRYFRENPDATPIQRNRRHAELPERFGNSGDPVQRNIAFLLRLLADLRGECDYNVAGPLLHNGAHVTPEAVLREALTTAERLLAALNAYSPGESANGAECITTGSNR